MTDDKFKLNDQAKKAWLNISDEIQESAFDSAENLIELGLTERQATSALAHALVRAAWTVAGAGKIAAGGQPDPDNFRAVVEEALELITWTSDATLAQQEEGAE